jgi:hypothetical protein
VAHPYAPLGGCYDDPIVDIVASTILKQGFIVGTFNFRHVPFTKSAGYLLILGTEGQATRRDERVGKPKPNRMTISQ